MSHSPSHRSFSPAELNALILNAIREFATEAIQITDAEGNYIFCNQAFSTITRLPMSERLGKNVFDVQPDGACATALRSGKPVYGHINESTADRVMISNASPIFDESGHLMGAISVFNDKTSYIDMARSMEKKEKEIHRLKEQLKSLNQPAYAFKDLIGTHPDFVRCLNKARQAAFSGASVLITGESGTGKELVANAIHQQGNRAGGPFIRVNCPAIPATLLESELFGHEKGAFTGAVKDKIGKFELAHGGSIFLDEIGDMEVVLQSKLLRVLQEREVERIGSNKTVSIDVRVIAATNQDLWQQIEKGLFRKDLYYRLDVIHIEIPPLRQRRGDIPLLVEHMLKKHADGKIPCRVSREALNELTAYDWPGNVRELENVVEKLLLYHEGPDIEKADVLYALGSHPSQVSHKPGGLAGLTLAQVEEIVIGQALDNHGRNLEGKKRAAAELGISLSCLYDKVRKYGL